MIPDYHQFILGALRETTNHFSINNVLRCAFNMFDKKECNEIIHADLDFCDTESIAEYFHRQFRQIDMTDNVHLDMVIWHAMHEHTNLHKMIKYIATNQTDFETKPITVMIDDFCEDF